MDSLIDKCSDETDHYDIANVLYHVLKTDGVEDCSYKNLSNICSTILYMMFLQRASALLNAQAMETDQNRDIMERKAKECFTIAKKLKTNTYKKLIIDELTECFL